MTITKTYPEQLTLSLAAADPCPCGPATPPSLMQWCGFKATFTTHDWCDRFYVGTLRADGILEPCPCEAHNHEN